MTIMEGERMSTIERPVPYDPLELIPVLPEEPGEDLVPGDPDIRRAVLLRAADIVAERGLAVGVWEDDQGRVCFLGAVGVAAQEHGIFPQSDDVHAAEFQFSWKYPGVYPGWSNVTIWNDCLPHGGWRGRKTHRSTTRVETALRRLADGSTWKEAIR